MKLYDVVGEFFTYLATFHWRVESGARMPLEEVQGDLVRLFKEQEARVRQNPSLASSYNLVRYPLAVFADEVILYSSWRHARDWETELLELRLFQSEVGGDRFFDACEDPALTDPEAAAILYAMLCLGFRGRYDPESEELRLLKEELLEKSGLREEGKGDLLCPKAYSDAPSSSRGRLPTILGWRHLIVTLLLLLGAFILLDRVIIWSYLTAPVDEVSHLAALRMNTQSPIPQEKVAVAPPQEPVVPPAPLEPKVEENPCPSGYAIQVGTYLSREKAESFMRELIARSYKPYIVEKPRSGKTLYIIRLGHFPEGEFTKARQAAAAFKEKEKLDSFLSNCTP